MLLSIDSKKVNFVQGEESISATIKPLTSLDYHKIFPVIQKVAKIDSIKDLQDVDKQQELAGVLYSEEVAKVVEAILPKYATELEGFKLEEEGKVREATIDDLCKYGGFFQYAFQLLMTIFSESALKSEEADTVKKL